MVGTMKQEVGLSCQMHVFKLAAQQWACVHVTWGAVLRLSNGGHFEAGGWPSMHPRARRSFCMLAPHLWDWLGNAPPGTHPAARLAALKPYSPLLALPPDVGRSAELLHMPKLNCGMCIAVSLVAVQV